MTGTGGSGFSVSGAAYWGSSGPGAAGVPDPGRTLKTLRDSSPEGWVIWDMPQRDGAVYNARPPWSRTATVCERDPEAALDDIWRQHRQHHDETDPAPPATA